MDSRGNNMDFNRERSRRSARNKRYNSIYKRAVEEKRPPKRLFTPEIKRFLKDWLIRRRDNPYPSRDEKKSLALQTGLTYIQVCNWFANWRRKLKNSRMEPLRKSWGYLIKTYNNQVHGNVEHFSICSEDSIWNEEFISGSALGKHNDMDHSTPIGLNNNYQYSQEDNRFNPFSQNSNKYKNLLMQKYLDELEPSSHPEFEKSSMINKWLQSAEKFKPEENNYIHWVFSRPQRNSKKYTQYEENGCQEHGRAELDAAEALTRLAANAHNVVKFENEDCG